MLPEKTRRATPTANRRSPDVTSTSLSKRHRQVNDRLTDVKASLTPALTTRPDLLATFTLRAEARAYLWSIGELSLRAAVDPLQRAARHQGLIARVGQDRIQEILACVFAPYREREP